MPISDNGTTTQVCELKIGCDSNAVVLTPSAGRLLIRNYDNTIAASLTAEDLTIDDITGDVISSTAQGTAGAATVAVSTIGDGRDFTTVLTLTNFVVGALAGAAASLGVGNKVFSFPAGAHLHYASYMSVSCECAGTAKSPKIRIGSVIAVGAVAVLNGTATFMDYITEQTATGTTATTTATVKTAVATAGALTGISVNAAASVKDVFLNAAVAWAADNVSNLTSSGTITLRWTKLS